MARRPASCRHSSPRINRRSRPCFTASPRECDFPHGVKSSDSCRSLPRPRSPSEYRAQQSHRACCMAPTSLGHRPSDICRSLPRLPCGKAPGSQHLFHFVTQSTQPHPIYIGVSSELLPNLTNNPTPFPFLRGRLRAHAGVLNVSPGFSPWGFTAPWCPSPG
jgi:hypothetical protein